MINKLKFSDITVGSYFTPELNDNRYVKVDEITGVYLGNPVTGTGSASIGLQGAFEPNECVILLSPSTGI